MAKASSSRETLLPPSDAGTLSLICALPGPFEIIVLDDGASILGCSPQLAPGHTPGHACWWIDAGHSRLAAWGDTVHFSGVQFARPDIVVKYDIDPHRARSSRLKLMAEICAEGTPILGAHVTAPGVGHLAAQASGYRFVPITPDQIL